MEKQKSMHILVGSMLFGLFFGAGNLIFPVHMGQEAGFNLVPATIGFILTGTGLPFLGVMAMGLTNSRNVQEFGGRVNKAFGYVMAILLYLTIGPMFALPRTATVSFEVGLTPILSENAVRPALLIFTIVFFTLALAFALKPTRILDWVGKILNPIFLIFIGYLLIQALINPMAQISTIEAATAYSAKSSALATGFIDGYQTMDALAALAFGSIVVETIKQNGVTEPRSVALSTLKSGIVTVILMCIIYSGLAWLGATSVGLFPVSANGGIALSQISRHYLGEFGSMFLAITITVACLKTAIGLITSCSNAFMAMFPNSFSYNTYAVIFALFSCIVANVGLTQIIALALPMLMLLYPPATALILLSFFEKRFNASKIVYNATIIGSLAVGIVDCLNAMPPKISNLDFVRAIVDFYDTNVPFFSIGFGWMPFAVIGLVAGLIIDYIYRRSRAV